MADCASNGEIGHLTMQDTKSPSQALSSTFFGLVFCIHFCALHELYTKSCSVILFVLHILQKLFLLFFFPSHIDFKPNTS